MSGARPLLSVVVGGADVADASRTVASLLQQTDRDWELLLPPGATSAVPEGETRVRFSARPLADAQGRFSTWIEPGGRLLPNAVALLREQEQENPGLGLAWSWERAVGADGSATTVRKPVWSPERLRSQPWTGRLTFVDTDLARDVAPQVGSERDLVLRVSEATECRVAIPEVLYEATADAARQVDPEESVRAVAAHLARVGIHASVEPVGSAGSTRLRHTLPAQLRVSVVVASGASIGLAWGERRRWAVAAAQSLVRRAGHGAVEVVIVVPRGSRAVVEAELGRVRADVRVVEHGETLDVPAMLNVGALVCTGDVVVLLDERTEIADDGFLPALVGPLLVPGAGATGGRVLTERTTHEGAGIGVADRRFRPVQRGATDVDPGPQGLLEATRECSTLGPGAIALRRATYDEIGGASERLPMHWSWDLGLKVRRLGLTCVWAADARVYHLPERRDVTKKERDQETMVLRKRWRGPDTDAYVPEIGLGLVRAAAVES